MSAMVQFEIIMIQLPHNDFTGDIFPELRRLPRDGDVRLVDVLLVNKDSRGEMSVLDASRSQWEGLSRPAEIAPLVAGLGRRGAGENRSPDEASPGGPDEPAWNITDELPSGCAAAIAVVEHCWARRLVDAVERAGGVHLVDDIVQVQCETSPPETTPGHGADARGGHHREAR